MNVFRRAIALTCVVTLIVLAGSSPALAWGPVTHYYINNEAFSVGENQEIYNFNGTGPDMFTPWKEIVDYAHSPNEKPELVGGQLRYPFRDESNFAYLILKVRGMGQLSSGYCASGYGWGSHITADWVAHNLSST